MPTARLPTRTRWERGRERVWLVLLRGGRRLGRRLPRRCPGTRRSARVLDDAGGFACAVAILAGVRLHRPGPARAVVPRSPPPQACSGVGRRALVTVLRRTSCTTEPFPSVADVFYLVGLPAVRGRAVPARPSAATRGRDVGGLLDADDRRGRPRAAVVDVPHAARSRRTTASASPASWSRLAYPLGGRRPAGHARPPARLAGRPHRRASACSPWRCSGLLAADVAYAVLDHVRPPTTAVRLDALWIALVRRWGAAALHPSMRAMGGPRHGRSGTRFTSSRACSSEQQP